MVDCPNLKDLFGKKYRVTWEEDGVEAHRESNPETKWRMRIVGKRGYVYPYGPGTLAVATGNCNVARAIGKKIRPGEECCSTFDLSLAETVFDLIKPRRVRHLSEANRAASSARLRRLREEKKTGAIDYHAKSATFRP